MTRLYVNFVDAVLRCVGQRLIICFIEPFVLYNKKLKLSDFECCFKCAMLLIWQVGNTTTKIQQLDKPENTVVANVVIKGPVIKKLCKKKCNANIPMRR